MSDGVAHSGMIGFGETYIPAFALALGHGELAAGLVATIPLFGGALLQLFTPTGVRWSGSYRRWVITCALVQALTFVPLLLGGARGRLPLGLLVTVTTLYWAAAYSAGSAWNGWMAAMVPSSIRARFFAQRARLSQAALGVTLLAGGALLHGCSERGEALVGFAALFALAGSCRLASSGFLSLQIDVAHRASERRTNLNARLIRGLRHGGAGRLFAYLVAVQLAVHIAAPYFTPYMLGELRLSYGEFVALTAASFLSRIALMPRLGRVARRYGARRLLRMAGIGIVPLSLLWVVSDHFLYLLGLQLLAGAAWAAYELAVLLLFFETLDQRDRLGLLSLYNLATAAAMLGGSLIGGFLLSTLGAATPAYAVIFATSSALRLLTLGLLRRVPDARIGVPPVPTRTVAVRPSLGAIQPPLVAALPREGEPAPPGGNASGGK